MEIMWQRSKGALRKGERPSVERAWSDKPLLATQLSTLAYYLDPKSRDMMSGVQKESVFLPHHVIFQVDVVLPYQE